MTGGNDFPWFGLILALAPLMGGTGWFLLRQQKRKLSAEARSIGVTAEDVISGRALEMYDRMEKRVDRAEQKIEQQADKLDKQDDEIDALRRHVSTLEGMMREAGLTPPVFTWPPRRHLR